MGGENIDPSASLYQWYMTEDVTQRIVSYSWVPIERDVPLTNMTEGLVYFSTRDDPSDVWGPAREIGQLPWIGARELANGQGFHVEVSVKAT